jgi:hypothetical protein
MSYIDERYRVAFAAADMPRPRYKINIKLLEIGD